MMTEVTQPRKYLFDLIFDEDGLCAGDKPATPTYSQEQLDAAKKEARDAGFAEGKRAALDERQKQADLLLGEIAGKLTKLLKEGAEEGSRQSEGVQKAVLAIARKLLPAYVERNGLAEIEAIVGRVIAEMSREPRLVVRVAESLFEETKKRVDSLAGKQAFPGEIVILGDPSFGEADCRVEWANGGIERDAKLLWQDIERVLGVTNSEEPPAAEPEEAVKVEETAKKEESTTGDAP